MLDLLWRLLPGSPVLKLAILAAAVVAVGIALWYLAFPHLDEWLHGDTATL
ncbi:hypothetical protein [Amycolatopsis thermophila]|uniref:Uncharacterized protein n=1 Tax=Amycolatopsis thermophila TaxID=206084 RepID=A0ABU0F5X0_9PSEU|nr:hypothetical protein [Amycolatopsis thermophila]MDQ0382984.1 hypothetical protein [Amycolatopsis thermophila]